VLITSDARYSSNSDKRVLEMLVIVTTIVNHFELSLPPAESASADAQLRICRKPSVIMMPMVEGKLGAWMGLVAKPLN
jgi:hypothetical protein